MGDITIKSRCGLPRYLKKIGNNEWIVWGKSRYIRNSGNPTSLDLIDYEGGPFIAVGDNLKESFGLNLKVKEIKTYKNKKLDNCYKIITEV